MKRYLTVFFLCVIAAAGWMYDRDIRQAEARPPVERERDWSRTDCDENGVVDEIETGPLPGHALLFDGMDDSVDPGTPADLADLSQGDFTLETWVWTDNDVDRGVMIGNLYDSGICWNFLVFNGGTVRLYMYDGADSFICQSDAVVADGAWHHVAAVRKTGENEGVWIYIDGVLGAEIAVGGAPFSVPNKTWIGRDARDNPLWLDGALDDLRVWNYARSGEEIAADMHEVLDGTEPGLVAYWRFDEGTGSVAHDSTGNFDGELVGPPTWVAMGIDSDGNGVLDYCEPVVWNVTRNTSYTTIQAAIDAAEEGDVIEVGPGRYVECLNLAKTLTLRSRDGAATTIIDGNQQGSVITSVNNLLGSSTVVDGFTITGGSGTGDTYCDGGGIYLYTSGPTFRNCVVVGNTCQGSIQGRGGGLYVAGGLSPRIINCIFSGNQVNNGEGGAIYMSGGSPTVLNCTFAGNSVSGASGQGGAISVFASTLTVVNSIFWGNTAADGPQLYHEGSGSTSVRYSCVEGGRSGTGNIDANPLFVDADGPDDVVGTLDDDLHLQEASHCVNAGTNSGVSSKDYEGDARIQECRVDIGADETPFIGKDCNNNDIADDCEQLATGVIYVDDDATGGLNDGSSWADAFVDLQDAMACAECRRGGIEILVAGGTHKPGTSREDSFRLLTNVALRGGYRGLAGGGDPDDRDMDAFESILSGDIGVIGDMSDNSKHVVVGSYRNATAMIEGFTITGGYIHEDGPSSWGAGMRNNYGSPTVKDCNFRDNYAPSGAGMGNENSSPTLTNCTFSGNEAYGGGGMYNTYGSPTLINCTFTNNRAILTDGGGMANYRCNPFLIGCTFVGNSSADDVGGGMSSYEDDSTLIHCKFINNSAKKGGAINYHYNSVSTLINCTFNGNSAEDEADGIGSYAGSNPKVTNCILWGDATDSQIFGNATVTYSCVHGGYPGEGNFDADPFFVDADGPDDILGTEDDDLRLLPTLSFCVDAGSNSAVPADTLDLDGDGDTEEPIPFDLAGNARFLDDLIRPDTGEGEAPVVDIGAYECQSTHTTIEGACCLGGFCMVGTESACLDAGGTYQGDGTTCGEVECPAPLMGDIDGDCDVDLSDLAALLAQYGEVCEE